VAVIAVEIGADAAGTAEDAAAIVGVTEGATTADVDSAGQASEVFETSEAFLMNRRNASGGFEIEDHKLTGNCINKSSAVLVAGYCRLMSSQANTFSLR
jgi:hypothetical protein